MTPTQVRQAEKLLVRLTLIKTMRESLRMASAMELTVTRLIAGSPSTQKLDLERPAVADLLDQEGIDLRRQLEALGVTQIDGGA